MANARGDWAQEECEACGANPTGGLGKHFSLRAALCVGVEALSSLSVVSPFRLLWVTQLSGVVHLGIGWRSVSLLLGKSSCDFLSPDMLLLAHSRYCLLDE